jgi:hypothetical protein
MGKKGKATKCMFLPKILELGIQWRFSLYLQPYGPDPHFQLQRKLGARFFQFSFWSVILNQMPIHEKKECPNRIIISSNMGIGNLVKETLLSTSYINPPFAFPAPKEKSKCISASVRTHSRVRADGNFYFYFFSFAQTGPASART